MNMKDLTKKNLLLLLILSLSISLGFSQVKLDLINQTINNDTPLTSLTIDAVTNTLGRPSVVYRPPDYVSDIIGPSLFYHDLGLSFMFNPKSKDPDQKVMSIIIHLVRTWDDDNKKYFMPFSGNLNPAVNANLKIHDLISLLEGFKITIKEAEERRDETKKMGLNANFINQDMLRVDMEDYYFNFFCEELTKFLEKVAIIFRSL